MRQRAAWMPSALRIQRSISLMRQATAVSRLDVSSSARASAWALVRRPSARLRMAQRRDLGSLLCLASARRTSSTALVNIWTTWNQSTVTAASSKVSPTAARKAPLMSQTTSAMREGRPPCSARKASKRATVSLPRDEDDRLVLGVEVDEDGDVGLAALGGGLVEADRLEPAEVEACHRLGDVVLDDAPQALIGDADDASGGDLEVQLVGLRGGVEPLADQPPRRRHAKAQRQDVVGVHDLPPSLTAARVPPCSGRSSTLSRRCRGGQGPSLTGPARGGVPNGRSGRRAWPPDRTKGWDCRTSSTSGTCLRQTQNPANSTENVEEAFFYCLRNGNCFETAPVLE